MQHRHGHGHAAVQLVHYTPYLLFVVMSANSTSNSSFFDFLKPRYHEAICRLKNSLIALVALVTLTHLLPLPTLYTSAWKFYRDSFHSSWEKSLAIAGTSHAFPNTFLSSPPSLTQTPSAPTKIPSFSVYRLPELSLFCLLLVNVLQSALAIRSPPAPYPHLPSPASKSPPTSNSPVSRSKQAQHRTTTPAWRSSKSGVLSPNVRVPIS